MTFDTPHRRLQHPTVTCRLSAGFTLIELMIVVAVIGILAAIAYPNYTKYVQSSRVTDGQSGLMQAAQEMERCYTVGSTYDPSCLVTTASPENVYPTIALAASGASFTLKASGGTRVLEGCEVLWIKSNGEKGSGDGLSSDPGDCW